MDTSRNELYDLSALDEANLEEELRLKLKKIHETSASDDDDLVVIPKDLDHAARRALQGRSRVIISKVSGGKLSKFAASHRRHRRRGG